jgi:DNA polymerase III subunit delta'
MHFVFPVIKGGSQKEISDSFITQWRETILENPYISPNEWFQVIGAEKKQAMIYTEESDDIIRKLNFKTYEAEYKIMIIWLAEKMNIACSNKLLKILEEPPPKTIFMLISEEPDLIIPTILSRTQIIKLPKIGNREIYEALQSKYNISEEEARSIVRISNGSFLEALNNVNTTDEQKFNLKKFQDLMRYCYGVKIHELHKWVDDIAAAGREKQKSFLSNSLRLVRENYIRNFNIPDINFQTKEEAAFSDKFYPFIHSKNIEALNRELNTAHYHIERNGSAKIIFLDMGLKLMKLMKIKNS